MSKKTWILIACLVLSLALGLGGSLAYLTDKDTDINTFTMGNVDIEVDENFEQNSELKPGLTVTKEAQIINEGTTDAWVWMTVAIPAEIADVVRPNWNTAIVNPDTAVVEGTIKDDAGNDYKLYTVKYGRKLVGGLEPKDSTGYLLASVTMSNIVDYVDGKYVKFVNGVPEIIDYDLSNFDVIVTGYAIQADGIETVEIAMTNYGTQWGERATTLDGIVSVTPESGADRPAAYIPDPAGETITNLIVRDRSDEGTNLRALFNGRSEAEYMTGDLIIKHSYLDGTYAMNAYAVEGAGADLIAENTTFAGWTSYTGFASAVFTDCTFKANTNPEIYNNIRPYDTTIFTNCDFQGTTLWLDKLAEGDTVTFVNCTYNGNPLTEDNRPDAVYGSFDCVIFK